MTDRDERVNGGGPWLLELPADLAPGEHHTFRIPTMEYRGRKRYFHDWVPMDNALIKNLDGGNPLRVEYNGRWGAIVEPNAADAFDDTGITRIRITNDGGSTVAAGDVVVQVSVDEFGADDAARAEAKRNPLQNMIRGTLNL